MVRYYLFLLLFIGFIGCSNKDKVEPSVPSNLVIEYNISTAKDGKVSFTAKANNAVSYEFDFGNGDHELSSSGVLVYTYQVGGKYTVTVKAQSASGQTVSKSQEITVERTSSLIWEDNFDGKGAPDPGKWGYDIGTGTDGWGNNELQYYTNRLENATVSDGTLKIKLKKESYSGSAYTSARILTQNKFSFKYGKVEIRAKIPEGKGTWSAGWMLGANFGTVGWPICGEIDIIEHVGNELNRIHGTLHYPGHSGGQAVTKSTMLPTATTAFHVYSLEWTADAIKFAIDGEVFQTFPNDSSKPFNQDFFIILNLAMGGNFGGSVDPAITEAVYEIDYVRVYN